MDNIEVIGVPVFSSYTSCITCKSKVDAKTSKIGYCTKCSLPQRLDKCKKQLSAKLIVQSDAPQKRMQAFGPQLAEITGMQQDDIDVEALLTSAPCCIKYNDRQVITSVYWKQ